MCDCCYRPLPQDRKIAYTTSKKVKEGFWCVACALDKHAITDRQIVRFLKKKTASAYRLPKQEYHRY